MRRVKKEKYSSSRSFNETGMSLQMLWTLGLSLAVLAFDSQISLIFSSSVAWEEFIMFGVL